MLARPVSKFFQRDLSNFVHYVDFIFGPSITMSSMKMVFIFWRLKSLQYQLLAKEISGSWVTRKLTRCTRNNKKTVRHCITVLPNVKYTSKNIQRGISGVVVSLKHAVPRIRALLPESC